MSEAVGWYSFSTLLEQLVVDSVSQGRVVAFEECVKALGKLLWLDALSNVLKRGYTGDALAA